MNRKMSVRHPLKASSTKMLMKNNLQEKEELKTEVRKEVKANMATTTKKEIKTTKKEIRKAKRTIRKSQTTIMASTTPTAQ